MNAANLMRDCICGHKCTQTGRLQGRQPSKERGLQALFESQFYLQQEGKVAMIVPNTRSTKFTTTILLALMALLTWTDVAIAQNTHRAELRAASNQYLQAADPASLSISSYLTTKLLASLPTTFLLSTHLVFKKWPSLSTYRDKATQITSIQKQELQKQFLYKTILDADFKSPKHQRVNS